MAVRGEWFTENGGGAIPGNGASHAAIQLTKQQQKMMMEQWLKQLEGATAEEFRNFLGRQGCSQQLT